MAKFAYPIPNGKVNSEGLTKLISTLYTRTGVIYADSLTVAASGTPDMEVVVSGSQKDDVAVFIGNEGIAYTGWNTADEPVPIDANGSGVTMKDTIVASIDLAAGDAETANAPDGLKFIAVRGATTDTAPTDSAIDTAVGHSLWTRLANVTVSSGATSINSGNITDQRVRAQIAKELLEPIGTDQIKDGAVTHAKMETTGWQTYANTIADSAVAGDNATFEYSIVGKTVFLVGTINKATTSAEVFWTGSKALPVAIRPSITHRFAVASSSASTALGKKFEITSSGNFWITTQTGSGIYYVSVSYNVL